MKRPMLIGRGHTHVEVSRRFGKASGRDTPRGGTLHSKKWIWRVKDRIDRDFVTTYHVKPHRSQCHDLLVRRQ
jgi:hypothetical protein